MNDVDSDDDQGQFSSQDEDENCGNDQVVFHGTPEETQARIQAKVDKMLRLKEHKLSDVLGDVRGKLSTRSQLALFSNHHSFISIIEPKKVYEALEDDDWVEAMHEELSKFERNKVWTLVERPKDCLNVIGWCVPTL